MSMPATLSIGELVRLSGFDRRTIVYYIQQGLLPRVGRRGPNTRYPVECLRKLHFVRIIKELQNDGQLPTVTLAEMAAVLATLPPARLEAITAAAGPGDAGDESPDGRRNARDAPVAEIQALFAPMTPASPVMTAARVASGPPDVAARSSPNDGRSYGLADAAIRQRFPVQPGMPSVAAAPGGPVTRAPPPATRETAANGPDDGRSGYSTGGRAEPGPPSTGSPELQVAAPPEPELGALLQELEIRPTLRQRRSPPGAPEHWTEVPITSRIYLSVRGLAEEDAPLAEGVARVLKRALRGR